MKDFIASRAAGLLLPLIVGPLAYLVTKWLKEGVTAIDQAPAHVKQAIVIALSFILAAAVKFAGDILPGVCIVGDDPLTCLNAIANPDAVKIILSALLAFALHAGKKAEDAK